MTTKLDRTKTEAEMGKIFRKLTLTECNLIQSCLQSIADERNEALGRVAELESRYERKATYNSAWEELKAGYRRVIGRASS